MLFFALAPNGLYDQKRRHFCHAQPQCLLFPKEQLFTYLSKLKDVRMHLSLCLCGDSSWVSVRSMCLHPASAHAVNAPHTSRRRLFLPRIFNFLHSYPLLPHKCFAPEGPPPPPLLLFLLSALHVMKGLLKFLRQPTSSSPTCSFFPSDSSHLCPSL